jgi:hypothetical protein
VILTAVGGLVGIALGAGVATAGARLSAADVRLAVSVIAGVVVSTGVGVFCGLYPAMRASRSIRWTHCATSDRGVRRVVTSPAS